MPRINVYAAEQEPTPNTLVSMRWTFLDLARARRQAGDEDAAIRYEKLAAGCTQDVDAQCVGWGLLVEDTEAHADWKRERDAKYGTSLEVFYGVPAELRGKYQPSDFPADRRDRSEQRRFAALLTTDVLALKKERRRALQASAVAGDTAATADEPATKLQVGPTPAPAKASRPAFMRPGAKR